MKKILLFVAVALAFSVTAYAATLMDEANKYFKPIPLKMEEGFKMLKNNPATPEKLQLGRMLYFEPRLSKSQLISCNTCHNLSFGGDDYQETSIGHGWQKGPRNAPTVLNAVYSSSQFWDGRASDLKDQAKGPIQASVEMAATPEYVVQVLKSIPEYVTWFQRAFPDEANPVTFDNVAKTIEVFEAMLLTPNAPFDSFLRGNEDALNGDEQDGLEAFIDEGCIQCHRGINFSSDGYYPFGVVEKPSDEILAGDKGRFSLTSAKYDEFAFKAPTLRNVEYTAPYFHSGKIWTLKEAVALMSASQLGSKLSDGEINDIVAFLKSLTGSQPYVRLPVLPPSTDTTPRPEWE